MWKIIPLLKKTQNSCSQSTGPITYNYHLKTKQKVTVGKLISDQAKVDKRRLQMLMSCGQKLRCLSTKNQETIVILG